MPRPIAVPRELALEILDAIENGASMTAACKARNVSASAFLAAIRRETLETEYQASQRARADLLAWETVHIADTDPDPQRARNRISARQWVAGRVNPDAWGDKRTVSLEGRLDIRAAIAAADVTYLPHEQGHDPQVIDYQPIPALEPTDQESEDDDPDTIPGDEGQVGRMSCEPQDD